MKEYRNDIISDVEIDSYFRDMKDVTVRFNGGVFKTSISVIHYDEVIPDGQLKRMAIDQLTSMFKNELRRHLGV